MTVLLQLPRTPQDVAAENFDQLLLIYDALWLLAGAADTTTSFAAGVGIELETLPSGAIKISATAPSAFSTSGSGSSILGSRSTSTQFFKSIAVGSGLEITETDDTVTISAGAVLTINWDDIVNKPLVFPPSSHTHPATDINMPVTVGYSENLQSFLNHMHSPGLVLGCALSRSPTPNNVIVASGELVIRVLDDDYGELRNGRVSQTEFTVPVDAGPRFFGAVLDVPNNVINLEMRTASNWNKDTEIPLGGAINIAGTLFLFQNPFKVTDPITNIIQRFDSIATVQRDSVVGGLILSAAPTGRTIQVSAGQIWTRLSDAPFGPFDTAGASRLITAYKNATTWVFTQNVTQWDNLQYNNTATGLVTLGNNRWGNHWFYALSDGSSTVVCVYGQAEYTSQSSAEAAPVPTNLPPSFATSAILLGRLTFQKSATAAASVASVFLQPVGIPSGSTPTDHNNLTGIQGGAAGDYYHLTSAQLASISSIATTYLKVDGSNSMTGNLNFTGATPRITGKMSGTTTGRLHIQSNAVGEGGYIGLISNGVNASSYLAYSGGDILNSAFVMIQCNGTGTPISRLASNKTGSASALPLALQVNDVDVIYIDLNQVTGITRGAYISPATVNMTSAASTGTALGLSNAGNANYGRTLVMEAGASAGAIAVDGPFVVMARYGTTPVSWQYGVSQTPDSTDFYIGIVDNAFGTKKFRFKTDGRFQATGSVQTTQLLIDNGSPYTQIFFGNRQLRKTTGHDLEIVNNANTLVSHVLYDDGRFFSRGEISSNGTIYTTGAEIKVGNGESAEKRFSLSNSNTFAYFYLGTDGTFGFNDLTRSKVRFYTNTAGDFYANGGALNVPNGPVAALGNITSSTGSISANANFISGIINSVPNVNTTSGTSQVYAQGNSTGAAVIGLYCVGRYAIKFGLDSDNIFRVGGWSDGATYRFQSDASGNFTARGDVAAFSDESLKTNWRLPAAGLVAELAKVKAGTYDRIDSGITQCGASANDMYNVLPHAVKRVNGLLTLNYGAAALVSAVELAKEVEYLKKQIKELYDYINVRRS